MRGAQGLAPGLAIGLTIGLSACGTPDRPRPVSDAGVKIGRPYTIAGRTYYPRDDRGYDEVGIASWYGSDFHGGPTANGERYRQDGYTAAHKTLPLPSYVEVTRLDDRRRVVVRVNDRGPFVAGRVIDLSRGAARAIGLDRDGVTRVRVRRIEPREADRAALRAGRSVRPPPAVAMPAPAAVPRPAQAASAPPPAATTIPGVYVQLGAFADADRARRLAVQARAQLVPGPVTRVRIGPFADEIQAEAALARARADGYQDAVLVRDAGQPFLQTSE